MKIPFSTRILPLAALLCLASGAGAQTASGEQRTHGVNAPGTSIGPSPGEGTPDPQFQTQNRNDNDANAKSPSAGAAPSHDSTASPSGASGGAGENAGGIAAFAIPIAAIFVGVPLAGMFWMRRSKSKR